MSVGLEADSAREAAFSRRFPVHRACRDGDVVALVSLFQRISDPPAQLTTEDSCCGWTPIHWAAHHGQLECVMHLVQMGCDVNTLTSHLRQTPTHTAAFGGRPHCVLWLTQAGADVNRQDLVGEAPIHKAARSGSLECVQVLLIAGAKAQLRNASGQTPADLAHAHGALECARFICNMQNHLQQLAERHANGHGAGQKRLLTSTENGHTKKARKEVSRSTEELDSMNMDTQELSSDAEPPPPPGDQHTCDSPAAPHRRDSADMCGSLHLSRSPSSSVSHRSPRWGPPEDEHGDFLLYGHCNGFGDTAEELMGSGSMQAEQMYLYHELDSPP